MSSDLLEYWWPASYCRFLYRMVDGEIELVRAFDAFGKEYPLSDLEAQHIARIKIDLRGETPFGWCPCRSLVWTKTYVRGKTYSVCQAGHRFPEEMALDKKPASPTLGMGVLDPDFIDTNSLRPQYAVKAGESKNNH